MRRWMIATLAALVVLPHGAGADGVGLCGFDRQTSRFEGTAQEQTRCLLRFVEKKGTGSVEQAIPKVLTDRVGTTTNIDLTRLRECLAQQQIAAADVGGALTGDSDTAKRRYFVIHDTSSPEIAAPATFPDDINESTWSGNAITTGWSSFVGRVHVLVNRTGASRTLTDFAATRTKPAVKLEQSNQIPEARPLFVHVENIQPRVKPQGSWGHIAPDPGFSDAQLDRLAVVYVVASARAGLWLIPAFHFNIDSELYPGVDAHDDPQQFDLASWGTKIEKAIGACPW